MMWPVLVPDAVCTTPVTIRLELPGINEDGTPREGRVIEAMGNYAEANKWIMDAERRLIRLQAAGLGGPGDKGGVDDVPGLPRIGEGINVLHGSDVVRHDLCRNHVGAQRLHRQLRRPQGCRLQVLKRPWIQGDCYTHHISSSLV